MLYLYATVLIIGVWLASRILLPEFAKPPLPKAAPTPKKIEPKKVEPKKVELKKVELKKVEPKIETPKIIQPVSYENRIERLETLLAEKNRNIHLLQMETKAFLVHIQEFDKVKIILEDEIKRLREQNNIFRSELGIPANQRLENSIK